MLYFGADGGGTKTAIGLYDGDTLLAHVTAGPLNYNFIGVNEAVKNLVAGVRSFALPTDKLGAIGIGDPSIDDDLPDNENSPTRQFVRAVEEALQIPVYLRSDAYMTLFGLTLGKEPAVLMLAGTGSMGIAENDAGERKLVGGWGRLTGDEGSGYHIASEGLRAALRAFDGVGPKTMLTKAALAHFGAADPRGLIPILYGENAPSLADFSTAVARCADAGDEMARKVLFDAADCLIAATSVLLDWSKSRTVGVYGSVLVKDRYVRTRYEEKLRKSYPNLTILEPSVSPEQAAAAYAKKQLEG